ncbi:tetratricopeptide repeat protein, partial [Streptomyces sp. SID6648]|nr:tetratricopeptide repeat protein [Streptomyces sp. SID6648]
MVRSGSAEGSGYVLGGRLVLTAAHVLRDRGDVSVQLPGRQGRVVCRVVWDRLDEGPQGWDAALLLARGPLSEKALPPVRWGRLVTLEGCPAQVIGYPVVGQAGADVVTRVQREGRVMPESGRDRDRYVLSGDAGAETRADGLSPWSGMSGAALWCGSTPGMPPLLTGVVAGDPPGLSHTLLEAVPAYVLASDPSFRSVVEEHTGRAMLLEPADLQHVTDRTAHPRPPRSPADLLRPEHAVVSFRGREKLLAELVHWCQEQDRHDPGDGTTTHSTWLWDGGPVKAQLLTGGGGAGKTRLATELCALMTGRGWTTIRLTTDVSKPLDALTQVCRPLLIVADYAETRIPQLHALLDAVDHDQAHTPVRILALARAAGDWWTRATAHPRSHALAAATVTAVPALHHTTPDRAAAYRQAVADFAVRLHRMAPAADWTAHVPVLTAPDSLPSLARAEFDTPLSVQMAALLALLDATDTPQPTTQQRTSLEGRLLGHEQKYWDETAVSSERGLSGERSGSETRALAVALACLTPATDRSHARELLAQLPGLADEGAAAVRGSLTTWLGDLYPAPAGSLWGSIQPDRIAEYHLGTEARREPALFTSILATLREEHSAQALTVLARTAQHAQHHDTVSSVLRDAITAAPNRLGPAALTTATLTPYPEPLIIALTHLIENTHDIDLMYQLSNQLTHFTLALSEWAAALNAALVEHHDTSTPDLPRLATALNNQAIGLASLGRREEALDAVTRAVEIRETLAAQQPDAFLPDLASSLNNQSIRLSDLGHREEALNAVTRAVETYQSLTEKQQPNAFSPKLAMALNNQSNSLASLGHREEALDAVTR